jgi:hypothetical protein
MQHIFQQIYNARHCAIKEGSKTKIIIKECNLYRFAIFKILDRIADIFMSVFSSLLAQALSTLL